MECFRVYFYLGCGCDQNCVYLTSVSHMWNSCSIVPGKSDRVGPEIWNHITYFVLFLFIFLLKCVNLYIMLACFKWNLLPSHLLSKMLKIKKRKMCHLFHVWACSMVFYYEGSFHAAIVRTKCSILWLYLGRTEWVNEWSKDCAIYTQHLLLG
jgi:hypothetical protein